MKWYLRQLIPVTYRTRCRVDNRPYFIVWKMWLGRCFKVEGYEVVEGYNDFA